MERWSIPASLLLRKYASRLKISSPASSLTTFFSKHTSNTFCLPPKMSSFSLSALSRWLFACHTFDLTIMVLRISLENTQPMLIESSSHSGSIPYYALDQLHWDGGPGRSMYLTQVAADSWDTDWWSRSDPDSLEFPSFSQSFLYSGLVNNHRLVVCDGKCLCVYVGVWFWLSLFMPLFVYDYLQELKQKHVRNRAGSRHWYPEPIQLWFTSTQFDSIRLDSILIQLGILSHNTNFAWLWLRFWEEIMQHSCTMNYSNVNIKNLIKYFLWI